MIKVRSHQDAGTAVPMNTLTDGLLVKRTETGISLPQSANLTLIQDAINVNAISASIFDRERSDGIDALLPNMETNP